MWQRMPFSKAVEVNPRRAVARGTIAPFVDMAALPTETSEVIPCRVKPVGNGGSRFVNGDTLFARITPCTENGKTGLIECLSDGIVATGSTEFLILGPRSEFTLSRFVYYMAKCPRFRSFAVSRMRGTSGRQRVPASVFDEYEVRIPPLSEQRKIVDILSSVDVAIEKTLAVIEQVKVIRRAIVHELMVKGLPGRHTRFKRTTIGVIPEQWRIERLSDVASVQTGFAKNKASAGSLSVPYLRVANVQDGFLNLAEVKSVQVGADTISRYSLRAGDVLFTEGGDSDKLGRGAVWDSEIDPCLHQNHIFVARSLGSIRPMFLSLYGGSSRGKAYFLNCSKQTTNLASMNSTQLKNLPVPIPGMDEQDQVLKRIKAVDNRLQTENDCHRRLNGLKLALMSVLLTGEVRVVPDAEAP